VTDHERQLEDERTLEALRQRAEHLSRLEAIPEDWEETLAKVRATHVERANAGSAASRASRGRVRLPHSVAQLEAARRLELESWR
jgi:hypothetical protein